MSEVFDFEAGLRSFDSGNRFFAKFFLLDSSKNANGWKVTDSALKRDLPSFVGKSFVLTPNQDGSDYIHPEFSAQEDYAKGRITEVGIDEKSGKAWAVAEITHKDAIQAIKSGKIRYVSPGLTGEAIEEPDGTQNIIAFQGEHVAGVMRPAFGKVKAQIKGQCTGTGTQCKQQLMQVQAGLPSPEKVVNLFAVYKHLVGDSFPFDECLAKMADEGYSDDEAKNICGSIKAKYGGGVSSSLDLPSKKKQPLTNDSNGQMVDFQAQINELKANSDKQISDIKTAYETQIKELKASLETERKKPVVAQILKLKAVKEENRAQEEASLLKLDAESLAIIASQFEAVAREKETLATIQPRNYRFQASEGQAPKNDDELMLRIRHGGSD